MGKFMSCKRQRKSTAHRFLTDLVIVIASIAVILPFNTLSASAQTSPPYNCWYGDPSGSDCSAYNGQAAAAYADEYALNSNPIYPEFGDDCTNFVSQALYAGGHSFIGPIPPGVSTDEVLNDDWQWWFDFVSRNGRTFSWSVANDLFTFENVIQAPSAGLYSWADPYSWYFDTFNSGVFVVGDPQLGVFVSNANMSAYTSPTDGNGITAPTNPGDPVFYDWTYSGDQYGDGFFADHVAIVVSSDGVDPVTGWTGPLIDEHTNNREHAIWSLIPYNSQAQTAAAWYTPMYNGDPYASNAATNLAQHQVRQETQGARNVKLGQAPALVTPSSPSGQLVYSGPRKVEGALSSDTAAVVEQVFQAAMNTRQLVLVPPNSASAPIAQQPSSARLSQMVSSGDQQVSALFTDTQLQSERATLAQAAAGDATSNVRVTGGGADDFHYSLIKQLEPGEISLQGTVRAWQAFSQVQAGGNKVVPATPHNILDVKATLIRTAAGWRVSNLNWAFAPGSQP
jgi:hypothetical protein